MIVVLFGPPGAGKGTQSQELVHSFKFLHISTGDLLRTAVKNKSDLGLEAKKYMEAGNLVPDSVVIGLIQEVIRSQPSPCSLLLDGFPRTAMQAKTLDDLLANEKLQVDKAIFLEVNKKLLLERLTGRRVCMKCGATYHLLGHPSKKPGICDHCGGTLEHRQDDQPQVIENRLDVYEKNTAPLKEFYKHQDKLVQVDGTGTPEQVFSRLKMILEN